MKIVQNLLMVLVIVSGLLALITDSGYIFYGASIALFICFMIYKNRKTSWKYLWIALLLADLIVMFLFL